MKLLPLYQPSPGLAAVLLLCALLPIGQAAAQQAPPAPTAPTARPAPAVPTAPTADGAGPRPTISATPQVGGVTLRACADPHCTRGPESNVPWPQGVSQAAQRARVQLLHIGHGRFAAHVAVPLDAGKDLESSTKRWELLAVSAANNGAPEVVFEGETGWVEGEWGERRGPSVWIRPQGSGKYLIAVGSEREDINLCGRPALLAPRVLLSRDLKLHHAKLQRLTFEERQAAVTVTAQPTERAIAPALLHGLAASSAVGSPQALTDANPETTWAEDRSGSGRGEFALLRAPSEVPIVGFDVVFRPPTRQLPNGVAPHKFWLVTEQQLLRVAVPDDAWENPGKVYAIELPQPTKTGCVAIVTDTVERERDAAEVSFAELTARTQFDLNDLSTLIKTLDQGGELGEAAAAALTAGGGAAATALLERFSGLSTDGQQLALEAIDSAGCEHSAKLHASNLSTDLGIDTTRSERHLTHCGAAAIPALATALSQSKGDGVERVALALASVARESFDGARHPNQLLDPLVSELQREDAAERRAVRDALFTMLNHPSILTAYRELLKSPKLTEGQRVELLRALGSKVSELMPESTTLLHALLSKPTFRLQYLLLPVAAHLSERDDGARQFITSMFAADDRYLRQRAAGTAPVKPFAQSLLTSLNDSDMRVRLAAVENLSQPEGAFAADALLSRLVQDPWPLVRAAVARGSVELPRDAPLGPRIDQALIDALDDDIASVRRPVVFSLAQRGVRRGLPEIRERLEDQGEDMHVRGAAASALGTLCDWESLELLTRYARQLALPTGTEAERVVARASLAALGRIGPADLRQRLAELTDPNAPRSGRQLLETAAAARRCPAPSGK